MLPDGRILDVLGSGAAQSRVLAPMTPRSARLHLECGSTSRKDNTGLDIKQLFIGSEGVIFSSILPSVCPAIRQPRSAIILEKPVDTSFSACNRAEIAEKRCGTGTLGVITKVALAIPRKPAAVEVCIVACEDFSAVLRAVAAARRGLGEILSAVEMLDSASMELVLDTFPDKLRAPLEQHHPFYLLFETSGSHAVHDQEKLALFLEKAVEGGQIRDGVLASTATQAAELWGLREKVPLAIAAAPAVFKYDVSLPHRDMYALVEATRVRLSITAPSARVFGYGHLGDGNLHLKSARPANPFASPALYLTQSPNSLRPSTAEGASLRVKCDVVAR